MKGAAANRDTGRQHASAPAPRQKPSPLAVPVREEMPAQSPVTSIVDADSDRAELTRLLLSTLAPRLGLRVEDVRIRVDGHADGLAGARGARGLMAGGTVHLRPGSYDPRSIAGRRLLGHEVTHVAQRAERHLRPDAPRPDAASAEAEADRIGRLFAETGTADLPHAILPAGAFAADSGAASIVRAQAVPAEGVPEETPAELDLLSLLGDQVRLLHKREVARFGNILNVRYLSGSLVDEACAILQAVEFPVAAAIASTAPLERRARLLGGIGSGHRRRHQRGVLAYYTTLGRREFETETSDLLDGFDLYRLTPVERTALVRAMRLMSEKSLGKSLEGKHRKQVLALISEPLPPGQTVEEQAKLAANWLETRVKETRALAEDGQIAEVLRELHRLLRRPSAADAGKALDIIAGYGAPPPQAEASAAQVFLVAELDLAGAIDRLIDALPAEERLRQGGRRDAFLMMLRARGADLNIALAVGLLSYKLFDLAVRGWEALLAYDVVKQMAPADQYRFRHLDGGKWYARLIGKLPDAFLRAEDFEGVEIGHDKKGTLADVAGRQSGLMSWPSNRKIAEQVIELGRRGFDARTAVIAYDILTRIGVGRIDPRTGEENPYAYTQPDLLEALVRRMDTFGHLAELFDELPESVLFDTDRLTGTQRIMQARDPVVLEREARRLLGNEATFSVVTTREAWLAFQLIRGLPASDRAALEAYKGGEVWSKMTGEMTASMQESLSFGYYTGGKEQRDAVRLQLRDARLWNRPERLGQLRTLIRMALAMGDRRWVFEQSRLQAAHEKPWLERLRHDYRLYDPQEGRDEYRPDMVEGSPWYQDGFVGGLITVVKGVAFLFNHSLLLSRETIGARSLDLHDAQSAIGGTFGMARLEERDRRSKPDERNYETDWQHYPNHLELLWDRPKGLLSLRLGELQLATVNKTGANLTLKAGRTRLSRLEVDAGYSTPGFERPAYVRVAMGEAILEDVLVILDKRIVGIERISIRPMAVRMGTVGEEEVESVDTFDNKGLIQVPVLSPILDVIDPVLMPALGVFINAYGVTRGTDALSSPDSRPQQGIASLRSTEFSIGTMLFEGVSTTDGQNAASIEALDIGITVAGNRPAYLRALIASLSRRILERQKSAASGKDGDIAALQARKAAAEEELGPLIPLEWEYQRLQSRRRLDPKHFLPEDLARLREVEKILLQPVDAALRPSGSDLLPPVQPGMERPPQATRGGAVVDIGNVRILGASGLVEMGDMEVGAIHGEGQSALLILEALTDGDLIQRLIENGLLVPDQLRGMAASEILLEIGRLRVSEVTKRGEIPTAAAVETEMRRLPNTPANRERREALGEIRDLVAEYEALSARTTLPTVPLSATEQQRLVTLHAWLGRHFGIRVGSVDLGGTAVAADPASGRYGMRAADADIRNIESDTSSIDAITGRNFSIKLSQSKEGHPLIHLTLDDMAVERLDMRAGKARVWSTSRSSLSGIELEGRLKISEGTEPIADRVTGAVIDKMFIRRAEADRLGFEDSARGMRVEVERGALGDIWAAGLDLDMPAGGDFSIKGGFGIDSVETVKFSAALGTYMAGGTLSSAARGDGKPRSPDGAMRINFASTDSQTVKINDLILTNGEFRTKDGLIRVSRFDVSTEVERTPEKITVKSLEIRELTVPRMDWRAPGGVRLIANGPATLKGFSLWASVDLADGKATAARIDQMRIRRISVADLRYADPTRDIHIRPQESGDPRHPLEITDIRLDGIKWSETGGATSGRVSIALIHTEFITRLTGGRGVDGRIDAERIGATFSRNGRIVARVQDITADLLLSETDEAGNIVQAGISVSGLDTGEIAYDGKELTIGAGGRPGFWLSQLLVDRLNISSPSLGVRSAARGGISLLGLGLKLAVKFTDKKNGNPDSLSIRQILIRDMRIKEVQARGLDVTLPKHDVAVSLSNDVPACLTGIEMIPRQGDEAFTIEVAEKAEGTAWQIQGQLGIAGIRVDEIRALLAKQLSLRADFFSPDLKVDFFKADGLKNKTGGMILDLRNPSLSNIEGQIYGPDYAPKGGFRLRHILGDTKHQDITPGLGAERVRFGLGGQYGGGWLDIEGGSAKGIVYEDPVGGVRIDVRKVQTPSGVGQLLAYGASAGHYLVPEFIITDAEFLIEDLQKLLESKNETTKEDGHYFQIEVFSTELRQKLLNYENIFHKLNGKLQLDVSYEGYGPHRFLMNFVNGKVNYKHIEDNIFKNWGLTDILGDTVLDLELDEKNKSLVLDSSARKLVTWNLAENFKTAKEGHLVSLYDLLTLARFDWIVAGFINTAVNKPKEPSPKPSDLNITSIEVDLSVKNQDPIAVPLGTVPADANTGVTSAEGIGTITLAPDGLTRLTANGDIRALGTMPANELRIGLEGFRLQALDLQLAAGKADGPGPALEAWDFHIKGVEQTTISFDGLAPKRVKGVIRNASVKNVALYPNGKKKVP